MLFATVLRKGLMVAGLELVLSSRGFFIALAWIFYSLSLKISPCGLCYFLQPLALEAGA